MENSTNPTGVNHGNGLLGDIIKGTLAGAAAVWLLDRVTWEMYNNEDPAAHAQEKQAQKEGKYAAQYAAARTARLTGTELSDREEWNYGQGIHYMLGIAPAIAYSVLRHRYPQITAGRGLAYGFGLFVGMDEIVAPAMGLASGPTQYPWQAHARGLVGHLVVGLVTDAVIGALDEVAPPEPGSSTGTMAHQDREQGFAFATAARR